MAIDFLYPQYDVIRNYDRCICCRACERQCANEVHFYDPEFQKMQVDESKCVACHRCVSLCPTRALKIVKTDHTFKENANWTGKAISEVYRQAGSGGVLLSSMGNPEPYPIYWDKILINASQVTNPSIDPLREPMETRTFLGKKPGKIERDANGNMIPNMAPQLKLDVLPSWHEAEIFTDEEFAALTLAESLTVLDKAADRDQIAADAAQNLTTEQISAIEWSIILINAFNRISIASDHPVFGAKQD